MRIVTRSGWGAAPPLKPLQSDRLPWPRLWLHHTAGPESQTPKQIQKFHQGKGWRDAAYNWAVSGSGQVSELIGTYRHLNSDAGQSGTIVWIGNYDIYRPSEQLVASTAWLVAHGLLQGWWQAGVTGGHSQIPGAAPTACPGRYGLAAIREINERATRIIYDLAGRQGGDDVITQGSKGPTVERLQEALGFWAGPAGFPHPGLADGVFGSATATSSRAFKRIMRDSSRNPGLLGDTPAWAPESTWVEYGAWLERLANL